MLECLHDYSSYMCVSTHTLSELLRDVRKDLLVVGLKKIVYESVAPWQALEGSRQE